MLIERSDFCSLRSEWDNLLVGCDHTVFSTWEWLSTWWKHFGKYRELLLLKAQKEGKLVGVAPLMYSNHKMLGLNRGKIEFLGSPHSDYCNFITATEHSACVEGFMDYLSGLPFKWDIIDLNEIPQDSPCIQAFSTATPKTIRYASKCTYITLPESIEAYMQGLKCEVRRYLKRGLEKLESDFEVEFISYTDPSTVAEGMNIIFDLHQKRWKEKGQAGEFANQAVQNFHVDLAKTFAVKNRLGLYVLKLSGKPAAAAYGFEYNSTHWGYLTGLDPHYLQYGVGNLLVIYLLKQLISRDFKKLDMMRGSEDYKNRWKTLSTLNQQVILTRQGMLAALKRQYWRQGNRVLYVLKKVS